MVTSIILYFIKVNIALAILYICYRLLFREDTFFRLRRGALLSIYLIAFLYQLPDITSWLSLRGNVVEMVTYYSAILPKETVITANEVASSAWNWKNMLGGTIGFIYIAGVIILFFRCLIELSTVTGIRLKNKKAVINGIKVCLLPEPDEPYSFFGWIFVAPSQHSKAALEEILVHERTHASQFHSLDVLLGELVCIICWFNPFAWLLKNEISINHEYLADHQVMLAGYNKKEYQYHLIGMEHPNTAAAKLYNNFSVLPLKRRISMLNKKRTNSAGKVKYLAFIPLVAGLLLINNIDAMARVLTEQAFPQTSAQEIVTALQPTAVSSDSEMPLPPKEDKIYSTCEIMPEYPGGQGALLQYLARTIKYPEESQRKGEQGKVTVSFIVNKDGSLSDYKVVTGVTPLLDAEALRVLKLMPKWTPGKEKGKTVRVQYTVPVTFRLQ